MGGCGDLRIWYIVQVLCASRCCQDFLRKCPYLIASKLVASPFFFTRSGILVHTTSFVK